MDKIHCRIYPSFKDNKFTFPELDENIVNPNKIAIALSGGGSRSYASCIGFFRALFANDENLFQHTSYISSVSGGAWFLAVLMFARYSICELLGRSVKRINNENIQNENFNDYAFIGHALTNFPFLSELSTALNCGIPNEKCYQYILAQVFLKRYNLENKIPVHNHTLKVLNKNYNNLDCIVPRKNSPFLIFQAALINSDIAVKGITPFEYTQMYSGARVPHSKFGGLYFQNQGLGSKKQHINVGKLNVLNTNTKSGDSCLESFMAASSAAYTTPAVIHSNTFLGGIVEDLAPEIDVWNENSQNNVVHLTDGAYFDNSGILALLARGCKKILSLITTDGNCENPANMSISHMFGVEESYQCEGWDLRRKLQVFHRENWNEIYETLITKIRNKEPVYFRRKLQVLRNWHAGVNGEYEVELFVVYNEKLPEFDRHFCSSFVNDLGPFPNYPIFFSTPDSIVGMSKSQVNITATYSDWYLQKIIDLERSFFESDESTV